MHQVHQWVQSNLLLNFTMWNSRHDLRRGDYDASRLLKLRKQLLEALKKNPMYWTCKLFGDARDNDIVNGWLCVRGQQGS